jgi:hypothetical protein
MQLTLEDMPTFPLEPHVQLPLVSARQPECWGKDDNQ